MAATSTRSKRTNHPGRDRRTRQPERARLRTTRSAARSAARASEHAAVWYGTAGKPASSSEAAMPPTQAETRGVTIPGRIISAVLVLLLVLLLLVMGNTSAFYVDRIALGGNDYLTLPDVYSLSGVDGMHIFFVDPAEVQANLLRSPTIASAQVFVDWGDPFVRIVVQEREPALIWEQAGVTIWVDIHGRIMRQREQQGNLLRVSVDTLMDGPPQGEIDPAIVGGAVQLHALVPEIMQLRYHPDYGLGYNDPRGWEVWFGTGTDMPDRMQVYRALIEDLVTSGIQPRAVFAMSPHRVWYTTQ